MTTLPTAWSGRVDAVRYGLELTVERGTGCGPRSSDSSARPMHWPELWPVQGTPSTDGRSGLPGMPLNTAPEFGTVCGTQVPVYRSSSSPDGHCASGTEALGMVATAMAGAAATATANPPARISRRTESSRVAIVTPHVVIDNLVGDSMEAGRNLQIFREFPESATPRLTKQP